jgi:HEAT repeat protein
MVEGHSPGGRLMLERLNEIRWERLHHALGEATDVPAALRALTSADPGIVREAVRELFGTISHQGTVYAATPHAVPFLIEIVQARATHEPDGVVWLLGAIAQGQGYYTVHAREPKDVPPSVDLPKVLAEEARIQEHCRAAVRQGLPLFIELLQSEEPGLRGSAIYAMAVFASAPDATRALLSAAERETVPGLRAAALLATSFSEESPLGRFTGDARRLNPLVQLARRGSVSPRELFQVLDLLITEDTSEALRFAAEVVAESEAQASNKA